MKKSDTNTPPGNSSSAPPRSLPIHEWPDADRLAWEDACRPGTRLKPGGTACYLAEVSREELCKAIRSIPGVLAAKRSAPAQLGCGGAGHIIQCRALYR